MRLARMENTAFRDRSPNIDCAIWPRPGLATKGNDRHERAVNPKALAQDEKRAIVVDTATLAGNHF